MNKKNTFIGPFAEHIENHIHLKKAIGYKYKTESLRLKELDRFLLKRYPKTNELTKEIVLTWCNKKDYESEHTRSGRASVIRQLAKYMNSINVPAYIIPNGYYSKGEKYIPYIYTDDELKRFFKETEKCKYSSQAPYRHFIMPIFFRFVYACGLRVSEARLLKLEDLNLELGIISINNSKNSNSRLIPMSHSILSKMKLYINQVHPLYNPNEYLFPSFKGKPMTAANVYKNFRKFLWRANISHGGRGKGPRIHDFRHTFAINSLRKLIKEEKDLGVYLPILRFYMGHDSFRDTAYYLKLTADVFPDITRKLENNYPNITPIIEGDFNETN